MSEERGAYITENNNTDTSTQHVIRDAGDLRKYFTLIPNIVDDMDLSPQAYRLYGHLKRVAGDSGTCWQSTDTLSKNCKMSTGSISEAKTELAKAKLISIARKIVPNGICHEITITDIWKVNIEKYRGSSQCEEVGGGSSHCENGSSHCETKKNPIKNINTGTQTVPVGGKKTRKPKEPADPRKDHPAIRAMVSTVGRYPQKDYWDAIIEALGDSPDRPKLASCWEAWKKTAFNKTSVAWAIDWYRNGIPAGLNGNGNGYHPGTAPAPDKPAPSVTKEGALYV